LSTPLVVVVLAPREILAFHVKTGRQGVEACMRKKKKSCPSFFIPHARTKCTKSKIRHERGFRTEENAEIAHREVATVCCFFLGLADDNNSRAGGAMNRSQSPLAKFLLTTKGT
jgi:hypothetical protein